MPKSKRVLPRAPYVNPIKCLEATMDDRRTLGDVVRAVWWRTPPEVRAVRTPDGPEWVAGDRRIAFSEDQPDDEGTMLYLWAEYEAETTPGGWETYWYCVGDGGGPEAALLAALKAWVAGLPESGADA